MQKGSLPWGPSNFSPKSDWVPGHWLWSARPQAGSSARVVSHGGGQATDGQRAAGPGSEAPERPGRPSDGLREAREVTQRASDRRMQLDDGAIRHQAAKWLEKLGAQLEEKNSSMVLSVSSIGLGRWQTALAPARAARGGGLPTRRGVGDASAELDAQAVEEVVEEAQDGTES